MSLPVRSGGMVEVGPSTATDGSKTAIPIYEIIAREWQQ